MGKTIIAALALACAVPAFAAGADRSSVQEALIARAADCGTEADAEALIHEAETRAPGTADLITGIVRHNLATENPARWAEAAITVLSICARSADPVALAYYGSAITLRAGLMAKKGDVIGASAAVDEGFKKMDAAVASAPDSFLLRLLRAENSVSVSEQSPFKRWDIAEADVSAMEKSGRALSPEDRAHIECIRARIALGRGNVGEGMRRLEAAIRAAPSSSAAAAARRILADFEE